MSNPNAQSLSWLAKSVLVCGILLIVAGVGWYGVTFAVIGRIWQQLLERPDGPMAFRFVLQPLMAAVAAVLDGRRDARTGRLPYFWTVISNRQDRVARLREGLNATARIITLGLIMDGIYQLIVLKRFYPVEAVIVAVVLGFVPYVVFRGIVTRIAYRWHISNSSQLKVNRPELIDRHTTTGAERFEVRPTADTHFGWLRTRLSVERTMMSWVRTAVSLIGFGFAIVQFFERMQGMPGTRPAIFPDAPKYLGLSLISCGILALAVSIWQYNWTVRYLRNEPFARVAGLTGCGKRR